MTKPKLIRIATVSQSINILLKGQLKFLNDSFEVIAVADDQSNHLSEVELREGVRTVNISMKRNISPLQDIKSLFHLVRLFKSESPDIVHSITPKAGLLSMIAAKVANVPIRIHTFTGLIFPSKKGGLRLLLILMDMLTCRLSTNIYPEGNGVKNDLIKNKITGMTLKVIGNGNVNGVDLTYFNPEVEFSATLKKGFDISCLDEFDFVWIFIGRIVKDKGVVELVTAFEQLGSNSALLLLGDYEEKLDPLPYETLHLINVNPRIFPLGFQKDIRPYLKLSDCLILPSYREGFPNVVLQAGAMGLPCIVTDINGSNEIILNEINGLIVEPKNYEDLRIKMESLIHNKELLKILQKNSRALIVSRFNQIDFWNNLLAEYYSILNKESNT